MSGRRFVVAATQAAGYNRIRMLNRDFKEFVELLNSAGVEYLIVGGYALAAHGRGQDET